MKRKYTSLFFLSIFSSILFAGGNPNDNSVDNRGEEITYVKNNKKQPNLLLQQNFRQQSSWKTFTEKYGNWYSVFNETNGLPTRAFGTPISITGSNDEEKALNFAKNQLKEFNLPIDDLVFQGSNSSSKHIFVNFYQTFEGLKVLESNYTVRLNLSGNKVLLYGADIYNDIKISTIPQITSFNIGDHAKNGLSGLVNEITVKDELFILPIGKYETKNEYKLVYEVSVKSTKDGIPSDFYTLVDANTGAVLYRQDMVWHCSSDCKHDHSAEEKPTKKNALIDGDVQINGTVYITDPQTAASVVGLPNIAFSTDSGAPIYGEASPQDLIDYSYYTTDASGFVATGEAAGVSLNIPLSGLYSTVVNNTSTPSITTTLSSGTHTVDFDSDANINDLSAYYGVNVIHDYMVSKLPSDVMNFSLTTNVDITPHECNAFYDGSSINFYIDATDCYDLAKVSDVIYHEYGHGINDNFYQAQGSFFQNGGMGEGYADVWAFAPNEDPILGDGHNPTNLTDYIRIYSIDPKVYPDDIVGEVHADGEIIAGAWWDLYLNLGSNTAAMDQTMQLFADAYPGLQAATANGNEGKAFTEVLIDVLFADDNDGDISNGTPNDAAIIDAFDKHGINLISEAELDHDPLTRNDEDVEITISADLVLSTGLIQYVDKVNCYYTLNGTDTWNQVELSNTSGDTYEGTIPSQPKGTIISYYLNAIDVNGKIAATNPIASNLGGNNVNLPHQIMVGYLIKAVEDGGDKLDFSQQYGDWDAGLSGDNNTTGTWENTVPNGSNDNGYQYAPDKQHTDGGDLCWVTERNPTKNTTEIGAADVDAGKTRLLSPVLDLTEHSNPAISYFRWYSNVNGANPGQDWFQVEVTNDGTNWEYVENTNVGDNSWRRNAFRVKDYVTVTNKVQVRFTASDSTHLGQDLDGGSLIEAALDDIYLWDESEAGETDIDLTGLGIDEKINANLFSIYPNPNNGEFSIEIATSIASIAKIEVRTILGKLVLTKEFNLNNGTNKLNINEKFNTGVYLVNLKVEDEVSTQKITIE